MKGDSNVPQDALPLTPRPNLEQYRKLAKDLIKACKSGDATAIRMWAIRWIDRLSTLQHRPKTRQTADDLNASARRHSCRPCARLVSMSYKRFDPNRISIRFREHEKAVVASQAEWTARK